MTSCAQPLQRLATDGAQRLSHPTAPMARKCEADSSPRRAAPARTARLASAKRVKLASLIRSARQGELAEEAGENTLEASGNDGSDAGDDAGLATIGVVVTIAVGAEDDEGATSLLLQPKSATAQRSAQREAMRFMEAPFLK